MPGVDRQRARRALNKAARVAARPVERRTARALVLLYHRVASPRRDPLGLSVRPSRFAEHIEVLRERRVVRFGDLARGVPDGAVAITFDDGYLDNLRAAKPVLAAAGLPATVFVATAWTGSDREFWWDELERLIPAADDLSAAVRRMRTLHPDAIERELVTLRERAGEPAEGTHREANRAMTPDEIGELTAGGLVEVGAHTRRHPSLIRLRPEEQRAELEGSRRDLEQWTGHPVPTASYPFGEAGLDWSRKTLAAARSAGFEAVGAVSQRPVTRLSSPLALPRDVVHDWDAATFERRLDQMLGR